MQIKKIAYIDIKENEENKELVERLRNISVMKSEDNSEFILSSTKLAIGLLFANKIVTEKEAMDLLDLDLNYIKIYVIKNDFIKEY